MTRFLIVPALMAVLGSPWLAGQGPEPPPPPSQWSLIGLQVRRLGPQGDWMNGFSDSRTGTRVTAFLHLPGKFIAGVDAGKPEKFTDDKGTDLLRIPQPPQPAQRPRFGMGLVPRITDIEITPDGGYCSVTLHAPGWPTVGATKVRVRGVVTVFVAGGEKQVEKKDASVREGIDLGPGTLKVTEGQVTSGVITSVTYQGTRPLKSVVFKDGSGQEITYSRSVLHSMPGSRDNYHAHFILRGTIDRCTVRAVYFDTLEPVAVPLDLEVGLGL